MVPGGPEAIEAKKRATLDEDERRLVDADLALLDADEYQIASRAQGKIEVTPQDMVSAVAPEDRNTAKVTASRLMEARAYATTIRRYRDIVNYVYWKTRCEVEQQDRAIEGRRFLYEANEAFEEIRLVESIEKYDEAWTRWASIHSDYPVLAEDVTAEDLVDAIKRYQSLLDQLGQPFPPEGFPMLRLMANYAEEFPDLGEEKLEQLADEYEAALEAGTARDGDANEDVEANETTDESTQAESDDVADPSTTSDGTNDAAESEAAEANRDAAGRDNFASTLAALDAAYELYQAVELEAAKEKYDAAWQALASQTHAADEDTESKIRQQLKNYRALLGQLDMPFPDDFPLREFVDPNAD